MSVLEDCGFCQSRAKQYIEAVKTTDYPKQLMLLKQQRMDMLKEMHVAAEKIDCIDFLICQCKSKINEENK